MQTRESIPKYLQFPSCKISNKKDQIIQVIMYTPVVSTDFLKF